ncbi:MAG: flagellar FliJ family protein [Terracidiphilus sp.]|jgi:flagellar FliJ protein
MAFRFSLASVLRVRECIETREELALQRVQFEIAQLRNRIELLTADIENKHNERNSALQKPIHARQLQAILSEINAGIEAKKTLLNSLATLEQEKEKRMKVYHAAHADRQMLSDMLAHQRTDYNKEQVRSQQKLLDEIFSSRSSRN